MASLTSVAGGREIQHWRQAVGMQLLGTHPEGVKSMQREDLGLNPDLAIVET